MNRRRFLRATSAAALVPFLGGAAFAQVPATGLRKITDTVALISPAERAARIRKAQDLMRARGFAAIVTEPGSTLDYFTGVRWSRTERACLAFIPVDGEVGLIVPKFEEGSIRETLAIPAEVRIWEEDMSPFAVAKGWLGDRKLTTGKIGVEETMRQFLVEGLGQALTGMEVVAGRDIFRACRMIKAPAEIALMQAATDVTIAAYKYTYQQVRAGMTQQDIAQIMNQATTDLGGSSEFELILIGESSAYPHGSKKPQVVKEGEVVLMDCGCTVGGYQSDVSRTFVFGQPSADQKKVWNQVHRGQEIALAAARIGVPAGDVDVAVRKYYHSVGYGEGFELPGLSHRTGHGIGLDGHEPIYLVRGEKTPLAAGMCFSNEPGIYIPGSFGVRLEDCFHMTPDGPRWFSTPPVSIDKPI